MLSSPLPSVHTHVLPSSQSDPVLQSDKAQFWEKHATNILQRLVKVTTKYPCRYAVLISASTHQLFSRFFDRLCFSYATSKSPGAFEKCLEEVEALDRAYHRTMQAVLNYLGANEVYRQLDTYREIFATLKQWLYAILCDILEGKDIVADRRNRQLAYQKDDELIISVGA